MKRFIAFICVIVTMTTLLTACGTVACDVCGKEVKNNKEGRYFYEFHDDINNTKEKYVICRDCEKTVEELNDEEVLELLRNK